VTYVIESGLWTEDRVWVQVGTCTDKEAAYAEMVERAKYLTVYYNPHGGRKLRVREVKP